MAPKLLEMLSPLLGELAVCYPETAYPDSKRATITRIGAKNQQLIKQWHEEFKTSGKLPDPSKLDAFDGLYQDLDGLTGQTKHSFLLVPEMDHVMPHLQAIRVLAQLTVLRFHSRKDSSSIGDRIAELGSVLRLLKIFEDQYIIGNIVCQVSRDLAYDSIASDIIHNQDLSESSGLQLLSVLDESATYKDSIQLSRVIRSEQIRASRFFYHLEKGRGAVESLMEVMSSLGTQSASASKNQEQLMKLTLSKMTVAQIRNNRDEYDRDAELILAYFDSEGFQSPDAVDPFLENYEQREQERRAWEKNLQQFRNIEAIVQEMVNHTWLTELVRPSHDALISASVRSVARRRVLIATLALQIASLQNEGESESLQNLFKRLNITESPIDPYSGQPLKTIQRNGVKIAYSVGSDRTDDRAAAADTNGDSLGDIFFDATAQ
ncbi:hypothetical protein [Roseimaritima multifibrata]|uniref:hypothetical protein n=1 Tax=Roseimaritima multifibrata TaxID=1930274 RepID=UPI001C54F038|nr:hypothetical protein [Roseimaritima multifibrata]